MHIRDDRNFRTKLAEIGR